MAMRGASLPVHVAALAGRRVFPASAAMRVRSGWYRKGQHAQCKNKLGHDPLPSLLESSLYREEEPESKAGTEAK